MTQHLPERLPLLTETVEGRRIQTDATTAGADGLQLVTLQVVGGQTHYLTLDHARELALDLLNAIDLHEKI